MASCLLLSLAVAAVAVAAAKPEVQSSYIVLVAPRHAPRPPPRSRLLATRAYATFLRDRLPEHLQRPEPSVHYAYAHAATGFAARLTRRQAKHLASLPSVLAVLTDTVQHPRTTRTPKFLGLSTLFGLLPAADRGSDVVIGVIDTGVYPKDRVLRGAPVAAAPAQPGNEEREGRPINETEESKSPLDVEGHGTHVASTAAGSAVADASFFNYGKGRAVGMAPGARIAAYKVCWKGRGCADSDILAAFDEAIADGVDVISLSLGPDGATAPKVLQDIKAIAAFNACSKGHCPSVVLGNGDTITGVSLYAGEPLGATKIPLVYSGDVGSAPCVDGMLNASLVAGKIVLCDPRNFTRGHLRQGEAVRLAGGAGVILGVFKEDGEQIIPSPQLLPAATLMLSDLTKVWNYTRTHPSPVATIVFHGTVTGGIPSSPRMGSFSSRGPNIRAPEILKPDVTAPGIDILAAWTGEDSPMGFGDDPRRVQFNIAYGTSMSTPHVSGIAALLRQAQPQWSPAAIKSALMTTAYNLDSAGDIIKDMSTGQPSTPFVRGAGHVDPNRALDPGLVYDADGDDYVSFLCALGYSAKRIALFTRDDSETNCSTRIDSVGDFNYPAFAVEFDSDMENVTQHRVMSNVGRNFMATYNVSVTSPPGVHVTVKPTMLRFSRMRHKQKYEVTFAPLGAAKVTEEYTFGSIVWSDGTHTVTSPIAITWPEKEVATM
ncbi:hypothetical protein EJB05_22466, partial [Eragrostis curvula]